jgi:hypothetical protein
MKISPMASTIVLSVSLKCYVTRKSGLARLAIQSSIFNVSNDGRRERTTPLNSGGVRAATYLRVILHRYTYAGVGKKLIPNLFPVSLLTLATKLVVNPELQGNVHTPASCCATQAHALLASI